MTNIDEKTTQRNKRMLFAGYITNPLNQKVLFNDGEMIQWIEEIDEGIYSIHLAEMTEMVESTLFELDHLINALKEFGINLKKE